MLSYRSDFLSGTFASYYSESLFQGDDILLSNLIGSTQCFVVLFFSFIVGRLLDADHSRQLLLAGSVIITIGMFMLSISNGNGGLNQGNYGLTWLTQGLVTGLGMACFFVSRYVAIQSESMIKGADNVQQLTKYALPNVTHIRIRLTLQSNSNLVPQEKRVRHWHRGFRSKHL